jgi:hypothetical protein
MRWMYDASTPPTNPPKWHVAAGYIGGDTPHVWTEDEWKVQPAARRLPIWTGARRTDTTEAGQADAGEALHALNLLKVPRGSFVALDMETDVADNYVQAFISSLTYDSYPVMLYASLSDALVYPPAVEHIWAAHWDISLETALETIKHRIVAVQWKSAEEMGKDYDFSLIEGNLPLWA